MAFRAGTGFRYPHDIPTVLLPWQEKLGAEFEAVAALLEDRDRALENFFDSMAPWIDTVDATESTTSTNVDGVDLATVGPTVTIKLPRGRAVLDAGAYVTSTVTNQTAYVTLWIDGAFNQDMVLLGNNSGGSMSASLATSQLIVDLSPGSHTFQLKYGQTLGGASAEFSGRYLRLAPVV